MEPVVAKTKLVADTQEKKKPSGSRSSQLGVMISPLLAGMTIAGLIGFGMVYNIFSRLRENSDQDRTARSAAIVAIKAYVRAGAMPTPMAQRSQITYALDAAARVVREDAGSATDPIPQLSIPAVARTTFETSTGSMPTTPISVQLADKDKDPQGNSMATAQITIGTATGSGTSYTLGRFSGNPSLDRVIGARVLVNGLSRSSRNPLFASYFGTNPLEKSKSQVLVVYNYNVTSQNPLDAFTIIDEKPAR